MQKQAARRKRDGATRSRAVSLDITDKAQSEILERKMMEAIERIERLASKTALVGSMLAAR